MSFNFARLVSGAVNLCPKNVAVAGNGADECTPFRAGAERCCFGTSSSLLLLLLLTGCFLLQVLLGREDECTPSVAGTGSCLGNVSSSLLLLFLLHIILAVRRPARKGLGRKCTP
jgi:hypothetical protein